MEDLELFYASWCPYCQKVLRFAEGHGIQLLLADTDAKANKDRLVQMGGKGQVPALRIGDQVMYESDDIIEYIAQHFGVA